MSTLETVEMKAFVPAKDYEQSKAFYLDLGFKPGGVSEEIAYFSHGDCAFLLQNFYEQALAENLMMHLLVKDVEAWWQHVQASGVIERYGVRAIPPEDQPWRIRDFILFDPSGVLWRIGQNI
ncbi:glyoxalase [Pseudomonas solani]|uniref:Glyoxalase n=1 Tax=Pseudomonas solani TaxID=2731552 RepID=A0ABM7LAW6_9PSED|nr:MULTISPECIES: VOC family protein [Pseudomonas]MCU9950829.1 VOC family protein [Pseudomonas sp. PDM13]MDU9413457.1 VOC family protein [Pseudomonas sp. zfem005]BCD86587.1 glyoxalase [Pseudomonas solani]